MTIVQLINTLKLYQERFGDDLKVILAVDPEGNSYSTTDVCQICSIRDGEDAVFKDVLKNVSGYRINVDKVLDQELNRKKVIGVCIYPFDEGFNTAEQAVKEE